MSKNKLQVFLIVTILSVVKSKCELRGSILVLYLDQTPVNLQAAAKPLRWSDRVHDENLGNSVIHSGNNLIAISF